MALVRAGVKKFYKAALMIVFPVREWYTFTANPLASPPVDIFTHGHRSVELDTRSFGELLLLFVFRFVK